MYVFAIIPVATIVATLYSRRIWAGPPSWKLDIAVGISLGGFPALVVALGVIS